MAKPTYNAYRGGMCLKLAICLVLCICMTTLFFLIIMSFSLHRKPPVQVKAEWKPFFGENNAPLDTFRGLEVDDAKCAIPKFKEWNEDVEKFRGTFPDLSGLLCAGRYPHLTYVRSEKLFINETVLDDLGLKLDSVTCCFRAVLRNDNSAVRLVNSTETMKNLRNDPDNKYRLSNRCIEMKPISQPKARYVKVSCKTSLETSPFYQNFHAISISPKGGHRHVPNGTTEDKHETRIERKVKFWHACLKGKKSSSLSSKLATSEMLEVCSKVKREWQELKWRPPNVLVIGIDSTSRLNFRRFMRQTVEQLKTIGGVEMLGYTKAGHDTLSCLLPMFASLSQDEVDKSCYEKTFFDKCPIIWKDFSRQGYITAHLEDRPVSSIFNYMKGGFSLPQTDIYIRPFMLALYKYFKTSDPRLVDCAGYERTNEMLLNYAVDLMKTYSSPKALKEGTYAPTFIFTWLTELTHERLNGLQFMDQVLFSTIEKLEEAEVLQNTLLLIMSDHGARLHAVRNTPSGYFELHLPTLWIRPPSEANATLLANIFKDYDPKIEALQNNSKKLVTAYDVHATLKHLLHLNLGKKPSPPPPNQTRLGYSLLSDVPSRSCAEAGIPQKYCICSKPVPYSDQKAGADSAKAVVNHINELLSVEENCIRHKLYSINMFMLLQPSSESEDLKKKILVIGITTHPQNVSIQAHLRFSEKTKRFTDVVEIERTDVMRKTPVCIKTHQNLKLLETICICRNWLL